MDKAFFNFAILKFLSLSFLSFSSPWPKEYPLGLDSGYCMFSFVNELVFNLLLKRFFKNFW